MKRSLIPLLVGIALGAVAVFILMRPEHGKPDADDAKPGSESAAKSNLSHDAEGNAVISLSPETQKDIQLRVTNVSSSKRLPEAKLFGKVADASTLGTSLLELSRVEAAFDNSHRELERMKTLKGQTNVSEKAYLAAEATYKQDMLAVSTARFQMQNTWGRRLTEALGPVVVPVGERRNPDPLVLSIADSGAALIRLEVPVGDSIGTDLGNARIVRVGDHESEIHATFFDTAPTIDAQSQSRGLFFLVPENSAKLLPGEAVVGYVEHSSEQISGVLIPTESIVRSDGKGWVYLANPYGTNFTRREVQLDWPTDNGWFVTNGISEGAGVVIQGAQMLLSEEMKSTMSAD